MPIRKFIQESSFNPEEIEVIVHAFQGVCKELKLTDRDDPAAKLVAKKVITEAGYDAKDAAALQRRVLEKLRH